MTRILFLLLSLVFSLNGYSQIIFGVNNYTEYHIGNLPIIISVPHGGNLTPAGIPDRTCNSAVNVTDLNTIELAQQINTAFFLATGCRPYIIYNNLHRSKLDCNRNLADGACGNPIAENAWIEFNNFINTAQASAKNEFGGKAFYIDLHGHGNPNQRLELGYLLYDYELAYSDSILNTNQYIAYSTIQNLVSTNINSFKHAELLRGINALGTLFGNAGYPSVPSLQIPFPGTTTNYFSGGYNVANHTSYAQNNTINGVQIECNYMNVRDTYSHREVFSDSLVSVLSKYLAIHQNINTSNCSSVSTTQLPIDQYSINISPNPATNFIEFAFSKDLIDFEIEIMNLFGQAILKTKNQSRVNIEQFPKGIYLVKITDQQKSIAVKRIAFQ